jgi:hypothetical protein
MGLKRRALQGLEQRKGKVKKLTFTKSCYNIFQVYYPQYEETYERLLV